jgi:hypothetical protein
MPSRGDGSCSLMRRQMVPRPGSSRRAAVMFVELFCRLNSSVYLEWGAGGGGEERG